MQSITIDTRIALTYIFHQCLRQNWAFVSFRLPDSAAPITYIQKRPKNTALHGFPEANGFVFAPFNSAGKHKRLGIIPDLIINGWEYDDIHGEIPYALNGYKLKLEPIPHATIKKDRYLRRLAELKHFIDHHPHLQKVVLSRPINLELSRKLDTHALYRQLCEEYPHAFVYMLYHPLGGMWIGATPEQLIRINDAQAEIVSLAGTQVSGEVHAWRNKENKEQAIVTQYIHEILEKYRANDIRLEGPYTYDTGSVQHLKTELKANLSNTHNIDKLVRDLHPTPAVCGYPQRSAMDWINMYEGYDRGYYTGYLGLFNESHHLDLYVNLRCMQIFENAVSLYVGGGITSESQPDEEWDETVVKSQTLLSVLDNFI